MQSTGEQQGTVFPLDGAAPEWVSSYSYSVGPQNNPLP